jgi:NAD+ kinase
MTNRYGSLRSSAPAPEALARLGLVVHPSRAIEAPLRALREWAGARSIELAQVQASCRQQVVAEPGDAVDVELIVSIGGDGTMLAALRSGASAERPVMGVACGSLGALTTVPAGEIIGALERFSSGDWVPRELPALDVGRERGESLFALNDLAIVRAGPGQISVTTHMDGTLFAEFAGDGCIVSTPIGSSAYALAAGGPLLAPEVDAFVLTPLTVHGGSCPALVIAAGSELTLTPTVGHNRARLELDGQFADSGVEPLTIGLRPAVVTVVGFDDQEPVLTGLRRRRIIIDSPRILARDVLGG